MDLKLDPVKVAAAVPSIYQENDLLNKKIIVTSEYENISKRFLKSQNYDFLLIHTYGATEAFPPQDADMIIDNTATGQTLKDHDLKVIAEIMDSSTRFITNENVLNNCFVSAKFGPLMIFLKRWFAYNKISQGVMHEYQEKAIA